MGQIIPGNARVHGEQLSAAFLVPQLTPDEAQRALERIGGTERAIVLKHLGSMTLPKGNFSVVVATVTAQEREDDSIGLPPFTAARASLVDAGVAAALVNTDPSVGVPSLHYGNFNPQDIEDAQDRIDTMVDRLYQSRASERIHMYGNQALDLGYLSLEGAGHRYVENVRRFAPVPANPAT